MTLVAWRVLHGLFHTAWSTAPRGEGYDKGAWKEAERVLFAQAPAGFLAKPDGSSARIVARLLIGQMLVFALAIGACAVDPVQQFGGDVVAAGGAGGAVTVGTGGTGTGGTSTGGASGSVGTGGASTGGASGTGGAPAVCVPAPVPAVTCAAPAARFQACPATDAGGYVVAICFDEHDTRTLDGCWAQDSNQLHCVSKCPVCPKGGV